MKETITRDAAIPIVDRILDLSREDDADILICIDCGGGDVKAGLAIYEAIQLSPCSVATLCVGKAISMAALLLACGTPSMRFAFPDARILIHDPIVLKDGASNSEGVNLMVDLKQTIDRIICRHTGRSWQQLQELQGRADGLSAEAACELGLIDQASREIRII